MRTWRGCRISALLSNRATVKQSAIVALQLRTRKVERSIRWDIYYTDVTGGASLVMSLGGIEVLYLTKMRDSHRLSHQSRHRDAL